MPFLGGKESDMVDKKIATAERLEYRQAVLEVIGFSVEDIVCASVIPDLGNTTDEDLWSGKGDGVSTDADAWWGW